MAISKTQIDFVLVFNFTVFHLKQFCGYKAFVRCHLSFSSQDELSVKPTTDLLPMLDHDIKPPT